MAQAKNIIIEKFSHIDRAGLRAISCDTSFLNMERKNIITDDDILADSLTKYFTDYEPQSSFVAKENGKVVGYLTGAKNTSAMDRMMGFKIIPRLFLKAFLRGFFLKPANWRFFFHIIRSAFKGEFISPRPPADMPAILHINILEQYRHNGVGKELINNYLDYLKSEKIPGVHLGTFSENGKNFFTRMGFQIIHQSKRTYLKPYAGKETNYYLMGKKL